MIILLQAFYLMCFCCLIQAGILKKNVAPLEKPPRYTDDPMKLTIALEPECASLALFDQSKDQKTYMIIDCGGGTVDLCIHQKVKGFGDNCTIRECGLPSGDGWGSTFIDKAFESFLETVFTFACIDYIRKNNAFALCNMLEKFRNAKEDFEPKYALHLDGTPTEYVSDTVVTMEASPPFCKAVSDYYVTKKNQTNFEMKDLLIKQNKGLYENYSQFELDEKIFVTFFSPTLSKLLRHIRGLITLNKDIETLFVVGGFGLCKLLENSLRAAFESRCTVIISDNAKTDVVKGAILYGANPTIISERISKKTYGIAVSRSFDPVKHDETHRFTNKEGKEKCRNIFLKMVEEGTSITTAKFSFETTVTPLNKGDTEANIRIYEADRPNITYVTEMGVKLVGSVKHPWPNPELGYDRSAKVKFNFSSTEILVVVMDMETENISFTTVNFLANQY